MSSPLPPPLSLHTDLTTAILDIDTDTSHSTLSLSPSPRVSTVNRVIFAKERTSSEPLGSIHIDAVFDDDAPPTSDVPASPQQTAESGRTRFRPSCSTLSADSDDLPPHPSPARRLAKRLRRRLAAVPPARFTAFRAPAEEEIPPARSTTFLTPAEEDLPLENRTVDARPTLVTRIYRRFSRDIARKILPVDMSPAEPPCIARYDPGEHPQELPPLHEVDTHYTPEPPSIFAKDEWIEFHTKQSARPPWFQKRGHVVLE